SIHEEYLEAGADIIETNSFESNSLVLGEYGLQDKAFNISRKSAEIARGSADKFSTKTKPRYVAGSIGPTTKSILYILSYDQNDGFHRWLKSRLNPKITFFPVG
ncbi:homocysteine S-methyltransferase family protein, partial [Elusimicrobiota bacterium]